MDKPLSGGDTPPYQGKDLYVSPTGSGTGVGTIADPLSLAAVLGSFSRARGKDTVWLRDGEYAGDYVCYAEGGINAYITFRPYPGEKPYIHGSLKFGDGSGNYGWIKWRNIEVRGNPADRGSLENPLSDGYMTTTVEVMAPHVLLWNPVIHDGGVSIGHWESAPGSDIYGVVDFNGGWLSDLRGNGQGLYIQNGNVEVKSIRHCFFGPHFAGTLRAYGTGVSSGLHFTDNVVVLKNAPGYGGYLSEGGAAASIGGGGRITDVEFSGGHCLNGSLEFGYIWHQNGTMKAHDNRVYSPGSLAFGVQYFEEVDVDGNILCGGAIEEEQPGGAFVFFIPPTTPLNGDHYLWDNNEYHYNPVGDPPENLGGDWWSPFTDDGMNPFQRTWNTWKAGRGFDANSTYARGTLPTVNEQFVWPNEHKDEYDTRVGMIGAWNWENLDSVSFDMSTLNMTIGKSYDIHQALDYYGDVTTIVYAGGNLTLSMAASTVAIPTAFDEALCPTTLPLFGCWIIEEA